MRKARWPVDAVALPPGRLDELRRRFDSSSVTESSAAGNPLVPAPATACRRPAELGLSFGLASQRPPAVRSGQSDRQQPMATESAAAGATAAAAAGNRSVTTATGAAAAAAAAIAIRVDCSSPPMGSVGGGSTSPSLSPASFASHRHTTSSVSPGFRPMPAFGRPKPLSPTATGCDGNTSAVAAHRGRASSASSASETVLAAGSKSTRGNSSDSTGGVVRARVASIADGIGESSANVLPRGALLQPTPRPGWQPASQPRKFVDSQPVTMAVAGRLDGRPLPVGRSAEEGARVAGPQLCDQRGSGDRRISDVPRQHGAANGQVGVGGASPAARASEVAAVEASRTETTRDETASYAEQPAADRADHSCSSSTKDRNENSGVSNHDGDHVRGDLGDEIRYHTPPRSPVPASATRRAITTPSAPPKPPRTFEHDAYVQARQATAAAESGAIAGLLANDSIVVGSSSSSKVTGERPVTTGHLQAAAVSIQPPEFHVYESVTLVDALSKAEGSGGSSKGAESPRLAVATSDTPPPLPSRPPPRRADVSAVAAPATSILADRTKKARSPTLKAVGPLKALLQRPWKHRREGNKMKRFASAECISAEPAATPAMPSSKRTTDRWSLLPFADDKKSSSVVDDSSATPSALYASVVLYPAPGSLTRSSSFTCVADRAEDPACSEEAPAAASGITSSALGTDQAPPHAAAIADSRDRSHVETQKQLKMKLKLCQAFSVLGSTSRKVQASSTIEAVEVSETPLADVKDSNEVLQKRLQHCSSVKQSAIYASPSKIRERIYGVYNELFSYALVVGLPSAAATSCAAAAAVTSESQDKVIASSEPYVVYKFPALVDVESYHVPLFCFPDADYWQQRKRTQKGEYYSFVLTSADGSRMYGYCERYMLSRIVDGKETTRPEVVCVTSTHSAAKFFFEILDEFVQRRKLSEQRSEEFLEAAYGRRLPRPGESIVIKAMAPLPYALAARPWIHRYGQQDDSDLIEELTFTRSVDSRVEDAACGCLLQLLSSRQIVTIFAALLSERKIVLCAERLSTLSRCVTALLSLLYPFSWQHALVPVLPPRLLDVVGSPTPFVVGVLSSCVRQLDSLHMDEVLVLNVDSQKFIATAGDEHTILPRKIFKALQTALDMARAEHKYQDLMVSEAFLYFFFESIGSIDEFICITDDKKEFQKSRFLDASASKNAANGEFARWFSETQMFDAYVLERCEGYHSSRAGGYEDRFVSWLQDPLLSVAERATTPMKVVLRNLFVKPKAKK